MLIAAAMSVRHPFVALSLVAAMAASASAQPDAPDEGPSDPVPVPEPVPVPDLSAVEAEIAALKSRIATLESIDRKSVV